MDWQATTCVVTGASRGIGLEIAAHFASLGASLAVCSRSADEVLAARSRIIERHDVAVHAAAVDVTDPAAVAGFAAEVAERCGPARVLVNNAGVLGPAGPIEDVDLEAWERTLRVNVVGAANVTAAFLPQLRLSGSGRVVNLSGGGLGGPSIPPRISAYVASKAAVVALTEALARELEGTGITVNALAPGSIRTGFMAAVREADPDVVGHTLRQDALRQVEDPDPIEPALELVTYLASERSGWLSGRLVSARWENAEWLEAHRGEIEGSSRLTLRRIDGTLFQQVERDR